MDNLLARALARILYSGNQRVEAEFPSKLPSNFVASLVHQLDLEHETQAADLPYSIWVRSEAAGDNKEIEMRHVKQPGEVVKFRNNHPRILVYREGDYEPITGVGGSSRSILPAGFPLEQSRDVALEALVEKALDILEEGDPEWKTVRTELSTEFTAVLRNWATAMDALSGQELNWNDAWWRYAIIAMDNLGALSPSTIAAEGATSAASLAGSYPLPTSQKNSIADSKWKRLDKVITTVLSRSSTAIEATTRFEARSGEKHPISWLDLEQIDLLAPQGPSNFSGNIGLVVAALSGEGEKCWGRVTEEHLDSLVSIVSEKGNQASIGRVVVGENTIPLPCSGASGNRPTFLLPIMEWEPNLEDNLLVSEVHDLELLLPWSSSRNEESPLPTIPDGSVNISVASSPATGLKVTTGAESASNEGLRVLLSLRIAFKVKSVWKTGPFQVEVEVPASHPGVADLEKAYEARIVLPVPWGITAVCSYGSNRNKVSATSDSAFKLDDGVIHGDELGMVTIRERQEPVLADLLVYDATQPGGIWPTKSSAILVDDCPPSEEWKWCWQGTGIELSKGPCVEDPDDGTILDVDVQEPDNRPFLPLLATLQDKSPSNLALPDSSFGEHSLIAKMDALLADHLLCKEGDGPHGLAQVVAIPGSYSLGKSLVEWGSVLWPFEQAAVPLDLRNASDGPSEQFLQSEEAIAFKNVLAKLCEEASALPSKVKPLLLARKQLLGLSRELVVSYLKSYASMVQAARKSTSHGDLFWATQPCSVIFAEGTTAQKQVSACLLSPFHPIRLGWLYSCEVVFSELHRSRIALAQVAEGWNFPAISQAPSQQNLPQSALMAIPLDPGPEQLFLGWSLMVNCEPGNPRPIEVPNCEYGELHIPGGATSGISPGGVSTALSDYLRSYPHLGSLVIELTNLQPGQRSSSLDQAVIEKVHSLSKGKLGVNSVRVIDDPNRRGTPPSQEGSLPLVEGQLIGKGIERFEWIRRAIGEGTEGYTDIRFVEDAAAQFSTLDEDESRLGVGATPSWALRRFTRRSYPEGDINCHILEYDLCPPGNIDDPLREAFHQAISATERTRQDNPRAISIFATLDNLVGDNAPGVEWVVIGNVGLDVATLSALSSHGQRLLWEWRPPFIDSSNEKAASMPDLSRRSFTCIASISSVLSGHIANLHGVDSALAGQVLEQLGARGVGLASLLSVDDKHAEGALGFFLAFEIVDKALSKVREKNSGEIDLILPIDAIDPFLRAMATSEPEEEYSRKKADLLIARITPPSEDSEEDWNLDLIPVEITCRGFTNPAKENFIGAGSSGVRSKQVQLENSFNTVSRAIAQMEGEDSAGQAAWVSALGCVLEMGLMLGLPGQPTLPLNLPELVAALSSKRVDLTVHPGLLLWFAHLQDSPSHESLKLPPPGDPRERPQRAIFVSPSLPGNDGGRWSNESVKATVRAIELDDNDTPTPPPAPKPNDDQGTEGNTGGLESSSEETTTKVRKDDASGSAEITQSSRKKAAETNTTMGENNWWAHLLNKFGMIGQLDVIEELNSQVQLASAMGNRLPDQLFVGPAGVGKSTIARKLADGLGLRLIEMNGASLRNGGDLVKRLEAEELLAPPEGTRVNILPSVVFIDEVHAIGTQVHDLLLSALDNRRVASHQAEEYSFEGVIILLATTDPGKLSDAFTSRPRQVSLSAYSLEELAAIVLLHGRDHLGGYELPREICIEVAARNRANPRQSVRCLTDSLVAHFFERLSREGLEFQGLEKDEIRLAIGQAMSLEAVCAYFDKQGIDRNGIDRLALKMLKTLHERGSLPQDSLMKACGISNNRDFVVTWEYCQRLGLVEVAGGRDLTDLGHAYVLNPGSIDLRDRIV